MVGVNSSASMIIALRIMVMKVELEGYLEKNSTAFFPDKVVVVIDSSKKLG